MYTSYSLTKALFTAVKEYMQEDLVNVIIEAEPEVLADEIFNMFIIMYTMFTNEEREELERRLFNESTSYDFATLTANLQKRFVLKAKESDTD